MSGNSSSEGGAWSDFQESASGKPRRYSRENFNRPGYERELTGLGQALNGPEISAPTTAAELYELARLIRKYPDHARELVAALDNDD